MGKPSIFSREYDRKMKARKKRITVLVLCIIAAGIYYIGRMTYTNWQENYVKEREKDNKSGYLTDIKPEGENPDGKDSEVKEEKPEEKPVDVDKTLDLTIPEGKVFKLVYSESNGTKTIKNVVAQDGSQPIISISPTANKVVILDINQEIYAVDLDGNIKNITKPEYITTSNSKIVKSSYLSRKPEFLWHSTPKFINDNIVVYISQMPYFKTKKTIYKVDVNTGAHTKVPSSTGENVSFEIMEQQGLKTNIDGKIVYINNDGNVIQ